MATVHIILTKYNSKEFHHRAFAYNIRHMAMFVVKYTHKVLLFN